MIDARFRKLTFFLSCFLLVTALCGLDGSGLLHAQGVGGRGARPPARPRTPAPKTPAPKTPGNTSRPASTPKTTTTKDLEEARKRREEKRERAEADKESESTAPKPPPAALRSRIVFDTPQPDDVKILATRWTIEARRGPKPFTALKVKVSNKSESYISVRSLWLDGTNVTPLSDRDTRPLPAFPMELSRFEDMTRLPSPIPPRSDRTFEFACPFALKSASRLQARIGDYAKFKAKDDVDWDPLRVMDWETSVTTSGGKDHMGLFIRIANEAPYEVEARLKVSLANLEAAGGSTFFYTYVRIPSGGRKSMALRSIPDEGALPDDPEREIQPLDFTVRKVEVIGVQF